MPALRAWLAVQTQWRHAGLLGQATGLDYAGVDVELRHHPGGARRRRDLWGDIKLMERAALDAWAEQRATERARGS